ncbi:kinase-like domain-containing protein [Scleroderma yunnanense]
MVVIQIFYDGKAGELLAPKKGLSKVLESMKLSRLPFAVKRKRTSTQFIPPLTPSGESTPMSLGPPSPTSVPPTPPLTLSRESTPMTSSCPSPASEVAGHHWVSTGSSEISPLSSTPDVSLACAASEEQDMLEEIVDPHHHPEVNGPRKLFTVLGMVKKFFQRERKSTNTRSLFRSPRRIRQTYEHAEAPLDHPEASESTMPFSHLLRSFVPAPSATMVDVNVDQFAIVKYLASGATGTVFEAEDNVSHSRVALKVIKKSLLHDGEDRNVIREQQAFVQNVGNSHAIQLYASFHDTANFYMVMPLQSGGDLHQRIVSMRNLPLDLARFYAAELMVGLYDLHSRGILHRDIKPSNLLIDNRGHLLISDFGLSHVFPVNASGAPPPYCSGLTRHLSGAPYVARGLCGTVDYMAPEIFLEGQYGFGVDYWAAGITLFQMLVGKVIDLLWCILPN